MRISIIIPAYNEAKHIISCLSSLQKQTFKAYEVIVVDDSSSDETPILVKEFCVNNTTFKYIKKENNNLKGHQPGSKIIEAFLFGLNNLNNDYDVICKFDADLIFPENYLEKMKFAFEENPRTGMFGGYCVTLQNGTWQLENLTGKKHLRGALKAYKKECYQAIGGLRPYMGWDTLDELLVYYYGWELTTDETLLVKHLKPTGKHYRKNLPKLFGVSCYQIGYDFGLSFFACLKMAVKRKSLSFFIVALVSYLNAVKNDLKKIVNPDEEFFVRKFRWNLIKKKIF